MDAEFKNSSNTGADKMDNESRNKEVVIRKCLQSFTLSINFMMNGPKRKTCADALLSTLLHFTLTDKFAKALDVENLGEEVDERRLF